MVSLLLPLRGRIMLGKILIVDDDPLTHLLYKNHLERAGYQTLAASSGADAIATAKRELPQLIIMDVIMAGMDGLTAIRELKKSDTTKGIHLIVISGTVDEHEATRKESEMAGATEFLTKPFSPARLLEEVRRVLAA